MAPLTGCLWRLLRQIVGVKLTRRQRAFWRTGRRAALVLWQDLEVEIDPYSQLDRGHCPVCVAR